MFNDIFYDIFYILKNTNNLIDVICICENDVVQCFTLQLISYVQNVHSVVLYLLCDFIDPLKIHAGLITRSENKY